MNPYNATARYWSIIRRGIATDRGIDPIAIRFACADRFDRVYTATPSHVGQVGVYYSAADGFGGISYALYGVDRAGLVICYAD